MNPRWLGCGIFCCLWGHAAVAREAAVPQRWGVYIANVASGQVRSMGDYSEWELSPNGNFLVGGVERGTTHPFYRVSLVPIRGGAARELERFAVEGPTGATFRWSGDSARVGVEADRDDDGKSEFKSFGVGRASEGGRVIGKRKRTLSALARRRLLARYSNISDVVFSPDGKRVAAYLSRSRYDKPDFDGGLWTFAADGTGLKRLTRNEPLAKHDLWDVEPHWLPDGKRLAFRRTSFEDEGI